MNFENITNRGELPTKQAGYFKFLRTFNNEIDNEDFKNAVINAFSEIFSKNDTSFVIKIAVEAIVTACYLHLYNYGPTDETEWRHIAFLLQFREDTHSIGLPIDNLNKNDFILNEFYKTFKSFPRDIQQTAIAIVLFVCGQEGY